LRAERKIRESSRVYERKKKNWLRQEKRWLLGETKTLDSLLFFPSLSSNFLPLSLNAASELLPPGSRAVTVEGNKQGRRQW
jgi:hypothetical protein